MEAATMDVARDHPDPLRDCLVYRLTMYLAGSRVEGEVDEQVPCQFTYQPPTPEKGFWEKHAPTFHKLLGGRKTVPPEPVVLQASAHLKVRYNASRWFPEMSPAELLHLNGPAYDHSYSVRLASCELDLGRLAERTKAPGC